MLKPTTVVLLFLITLSHVYGQKCSNGERSNSKDDPDELKYINSNWKEISQNLTRLEKKLKEANEELRKIGKKFIETNEKIVNHVSMCLINPQISNRDSELPDFYWRMKIQYQIETEKIPKIDMERIEALIMEKVDRKKVQGVANEFWNLRRRLQCYRVLDADLADKMIKTVTDLFTAYFAVDEDVDEVIEDDKEEESESAFSSDNELQESVNSKDPEGFKYIDNNWNTIRRYVVGNGENLKDANEKLSNIDEFLARMGEKNRDHVAFCLTGPDGPDADSFSYWKKTMEYRYYRFYKSIKEIPSTELDMERVKALFQDTADEKRIDEVAMELWTFSQRLQCLEALNPNVKDELIDKAASLFETYLYMSKWIDDDIKRLTTENTRLSGMNLFMLLLIFLYHRYVRVHMPLCLVNVVGYSLNIVQIYISGQSMYNGNRILRNLWIFDTDFPCIL